jgi:hypothetical protein
MQDGAMQTIRALFSLFCRVALLALAVPVLVGDFPGHAFPSRPTQDWSMPTACDALAVAAPLMRGRKLAFLAGVLVLAVRYYFRHYVPVSDLAYMGAAIVLVLLPASGRGSGKEKAKTR